MRNILNSAMTLAFLLLGSPSSEAASGAASSLNPSTPPTVKPVKKDKAQYSVSMREIPCPPATPEEAKIPTTLNSVIKMCGYSYSVVANALDNGELIWESVLYTRDYNLEKDRASQVIHPISLKLKKGISAVVKNQKGDEFVVWLERGYLTKPPTPKSYPKEK